MLSDPGGSTNLSLYETSGANIFKNVELGLDHLEKVPDTKTFIIPGESYEDIDFYWLMIEMESPEGVGSSMWRESGGEELYGK